MPRKARELAHGFRDGVLPAEELLHLSGRHLTRHQNGHQRIVRLPLVGDDLARRSGEIGRSFLEQALSDGLSSQCWALATESKR